MARGRFAHQTPAPPPRPRTIVSSAINVRRDQFKVVLQERPEAQECWRYYRLIGMVRSSINWLAAACSRSRLYIGRIDPDGAGDPEPVDDERIQNVIRNFAGGQQGQSQLIHRMVVHLQVVGQTFLIRIVDPDTKQPRYVAATASEVQRKGDDVQLLLDEKTKVPLADDDVTRIWTPDEVQAWKATSTVESVLPECKQLAALNAHILASADSRLAGNGILTVPQSATLSAATAGDQNTGIDDPFMSDLTEAMMTPLEDRSSAAAVVPIVIRVPDESVNGIKHIETSTPFDSMVPDLIETAKKNVALGLDAPPEIVLGIGDTNHWNAEAIDSQSIRIHVQPNLQTITSAFSEKWLPYAMQEAGLTWDPSLVVWADVSDLTQEPDRTESAIELFKLNAISNEALLRITGMAETDAPTPDELRHQLMVKLAETPQGAQLVAQMLGLPAADSSEADLPAPVAEPAEAAEIPAEPERPQLAPVAASGGTWGVEQCELAVLRALELAGKRLLNPTTRGRYRDVHAWELHTRLTAPIGELDRLMDGAWDMLHELGAPEPLVFALDRYTRGLIATGQPHEPGTLHRLFGGTQRAA